MTLMSWWKSKLPEKFKLILIWLPPKKWGNRLNLHYAQKILKPNRQKNKILNHTQIMRQNLYLNGILELFLRNRQAVLITKQIVMRRTANNSLLIKLREISKRRLSKRIKIALLRSRVQTRMSSSRVHRITKK